MVKAMLNIINFFRPRKPVMFALDTSSSHVAKLIYKVRGDACGNTALRTVYGIPCSSTAFGAPCETAIRLASYGFVRAYRRGRRIVIERNPSETPPAEVESWLVCPDMALMIPEYYGSNPNNAYVFVRTPFGDVEDHYAEEHEWPRYYLGDLVVCDGVEGRRKFFEEVVDKIYSPS